MDQPLTATVRTREGDVHPDQLGGLLDSRGGAARLLPPFAVIRSLPGGELRARADSMGLRQLYYGERGGIAGFSTSAVLLAACLGADVDRLGVAVQAWLGWQLGQRTLHTAVHKLPPGSEIRLGSSGLHLIHETAVPGDRIGLAEAVDRSAALLQALLERYLDERPQAVLQLTGGQDSRILLSAVPRSRRAGLRAMTLGGPQDPDVLVAASIAHMEGLQHEVRGLDGIEELDSSEAWRRVERAATQLDGMADPLATAALTWAEERFAPAPRLSGLGGEVARGFYYYGSVRERPVTASRSRQLAAWRLFVNEAVQPEALTRDFGAWSRASAEREVCQHLRATGRSWLEATDDLYLRHRMQRWAGVTETVWCLDREIVNPMLDPEFLEIAGRLAPRDKRNSMFLAQLQMSLDGSLGRLPLEGRPPPAAYARSGLRSTATVAGSTGGRLVRKGFQKLRGAPRAPAGGGVLADKVVTHWRQNPELLESARGVGVLADSWVEDLLSARLQPTPSSVSFITNLLLLSRHSSLT